MIEYLKKGLAEAQRIEEKNSVKDVVANALKEIEGGGDVAVRSMSEKFDNYSPHSFRLSDDEIQSLMAKLSQQEMADVKFAQAQVRNFAIAQRESMKDIEVEPLPGVILGHKNIPVQTLQLSLPCIWGVRTRFMYSAGFKLLVLWLWAQRQSRLYICWLVRVMPL